MQRMTKSAMTEAAKLLGKKGGLARSKRKKETAKENGKLGGRPKKAANQELQVTA